MKNVTSINGWHPIDVLQQVSDEIAAVDSMFVLTMNKEGECGAFASNISIQDLLVMKATIDAYVRERVDINRGN